jgi:hypothetical protein
MRPRSTKRLFDVAPVLIAPILAASNDAWAQAGSASVTSWRWVELGPWFGALVTFLAVLVALRLHAHILPPRLTVRLRSLDGEATTVLVQVAEPDGGALRTTGSIPARYYHVDLSNERPFFPATDVGVFLTGVEVLTANGVYTQLWSGAVPLTATHYGVHPDRTLGAAPQQYDLCSIVKDRHFQLHPRIFPNNLPALFSATGGTGKLRVRCRHDMCLKLSGTANGQKARRRCDSIWLLNK